LRPAAPIAEQAPAADRPALGADVVLLALACLPVAIAATLAITRHWMPFSDNAIIAARVRDSLSAHPPTVGMPTTLAAYVDAKVTYHPGPLGFWALAIPYWVSGWSPVGLVVGEALVNAGSVAGIWWVLRRSGSTMVVAGQLVVLAAMILGLGATPLFEPWNATNAILPLTLLLAGTVAVVARGDLGVLPVTVLAGSFAGQAHLSYLAVGLAAVTLLAIGTVGWLAQQRRSFGRTPAVRRRTWLLVGGSVALGIVAWIGPLVQEVRGHPGNMTNVLDGLSTSRFPAAGPGFATRAFASVVGLPPPFGTAYSSASFPVLSPSLFDIVRALLPVVVLAGLGLLVWSRRRWPEARSLVVAAALAAAGFATAARAPVGAHQVFTYNIRALWPLAAVLWMEVVGVVAGLVGPLVAKRVDRASAASAHRSLKPIRMGALGTLMLLLLAIGVWPRPAPSFGEEVHQHLVRQLSARVDSIPIGRYRVQLEGGTARFETGPAVIVALERAGVSTVVAEPGTNADLFGSQRADRGQRVKGELLVVSGSAPTRGRVVATATGLNDDQRAELRLLRARFKTGVTVDGELQLTPRGRAQLRGTAGRSIRQILSIGTGSSSAPNFADVVGNGLIKPPKGLTAAELDRLAELSRFDGPEWTVRLERLG